MIEVYKIGNENFEWNGDIVLDPNYCKMKVVLNKENNLELEHDIDIEGRWKYLKNDAVIKVPAPFLKPQLYRIYDIDKDDDTINVLAKPVFYDLEKKILLDCRPTNANGQQALDKILENTKFNGHSNIISSFTSHYIRKSIVDALISNDENSFFSKIGGELLIDNYDIYINDKVGIKNNYRFEYSKDITGISINENTKELYTRIIPVAYNGHTIPENYVDSKLISNYDEVKEIEIKFEDLKLKEDCNNEDEEGFETKEELYKALRKEAQKLFDDGLDKPNLSITIDVALLKNTTEYKNYKDIINVGLGDTVKAYYKKLGVDIDIRLIGYEWDCINEEYINVSLGEKSNDFISSTASANSKINNILNSNGNVNAEKLQGLVNAFNTKFGAMRDIAQPQQVRAILFEDRIKGSKTYGATAIGTNGLMIASERTVDDRDWNWKTFIGGGYAYADWLIGKLKTVLIQNLDGSFEIDLTKAGGALFRNNGKDAIKIKNNSIELFNWAKEGDYIGGLTALCKGDDPDKPIIGLVNDIDSVVSIGYLNSNKPGTYPSYIEFDKYGVMKRKQPITVYEDIGVLNNSIFLGNDSEQELYSSVGKQLILKTKDGFAIIDKESGNIMHNLGNKKAAFAEVGKNDYYAVIEENRFWFGKNGNGYFFKDIGANTLWSMYDFSVDKNLHVNGNITCSGNKNNVQETIDYGIRSLYATEDCESYFTDRCTETFTVEEIIHEDNSVTYERIILLDCTYKQLANTESDYIVDIHKQGFGDFRIKEQTSNYFIVESDRKDFLFKYTIIAKRRGYERLRLEEIIINETDNSNTFNNGREIIAYNKEKNLYK